MGHLAVAFENFNPFRRFQNILSATLSKLGIKNAFEIPFCSSASKKFALSPGSVSL